MYYLDLEIESDVFLGLRCDTNNMLKNLIGRMVEKNTLTGSITVKVNIALEPQVSDYGKRILVPTFNHKVTSSMQIKDELKGAAFTENMQIVLDEETGNYVLKYGNMEEQSTIFDKADEADK